MAHVLVGEPMFISPEQALTHAQRPEFLNAKRRA
jgi:hypothetical protein